MNDEERFDPKKHSLEDAAKRLKQISEKDYYARVAEVMGRHEEEDTSEILPDEALSPEDLEARKKGQALADFIGGTTQSILDRYPLTEDRVRALIREEVHRTIYPTAEMVNPHVHRRIEMTEESGDKWRGVLYKVEPEEPETRRSYALKAKHEKGPSGTCWVCGKHGDDMGTFVRGPGLPRELIHNTGECIAGAYRKDREVEKGEE